ncbi:MAG: MerR family transcriptional regulator [Raoultibacter sp.]
MQEKADRSSSVDTAATPRYPIREVSDITGISAYTLRYYDKCGFFPHLYRDKHKVRSFSDADIEQLHLVDALRKSGLSIEGIQYYVKLDRKGAPTQSERLAILQARQSVLEYQLSEAQEGLRVLQAEASTLAFRLKNDDEAL